MLVCALNQTTFERGVRSPTPGICVRGAPPARRQGRTVGAGGGSIGKGASLGRGHWRCLGMLCNTGAGIGERLDRNSCV